MSFKEFLDINIELKFADEEFQMKKFEHFEERRQMKVKRAIEVYKNFTSNLETQRINQ